MVWKSKLIFHVNFVVDISFIYFLKKEKSQLVLDDTLLFSLF